MSTPIVWETLEKLMRKKIAYLDYWFSCCGSLSQKKKGGSKKNLESGGGKACASIRLEPL